MREMYKHRLTPRHISRQPNLCEYTYGVPCILFRSRRTRILSWGARCALLETGRAWGCGLYKKEAELSCSATVTGLSILWTPASRHDQQREV